jgi:hypothetical protein
MKERISIVFLAISLVFGFSACDLENEKGFIFDEKTFNSEWTKWENRNILNYGFTVNGKFLYWNKPRAILMFDYEVNIIVKNGVMESFEYIGQNVPYDDDDVLEPEITTISGLYKKISDRAKAEKDWWDNNSPNGIISTTLNIEYDSQLNYIASYEPVSSWESGWIVDTTDHAIRISNFTILDN